jgi:hypothetical protein
MREFHNLILFEWGKGRGDEDPTKDKV